MGLDFGKTAQQITTAVPEEKNEIEVVRGGRRDFESVGYRLKQYEYVSVG